MRMNLRLVRNPKVRFKIRVIKRVSDKKTGIIVNPGMVLDNLTQHDKPIDGIRYYPEGRTDSYFMLMPLDCFDLLEKYEVKNE